ncbi:MAG: hypothetical protein J6J12_04885 [Oscillospiraceae bacterium]|nr:hypothetical protein [Oscillospiraceae bacterium]
MDTLWMVVAVVLVLGLGAKFLSPSQKPGKVCQSCPEFKRCGGGKPRCPRRGGSI